MMASIFKDMSYKSCIEYYHRSKGGLTRQALDERRKMIRKYHVDSYKPEDFLVNNKPNEKSYKELKSQSRKNLTNEEPEESTRDEKYRIGLINLILYIKEKFPKIKQSELAKIIKLNKSVISRILKKKRNI